MMAVVLLPLILLTGCASSPDGTDPTMTPEQAQQQLTELFSTTSALVVGDWNLEFNGARDCTTQAGQVGVVFDLVGLGPGSADPGSAADQVAALWTDRGHPVTRSVIDSNAIRLLSPDDADGFGLEFTVNDRASTLDGSTPCVPGDAAALNRARQQDVPSR